MPDWVNSRLNDILGGKDYWTHTTSPSDELEIVTQADRQVEEFEPLHFETGCGIKMRGGKAVEAVCPSTHVEWVVKGEILRAYPKSAQAMDPVLLIFDDGSGAMVPLLHEFIAELSFENGEWVGLAYEASENSPFHDPDPASRRKRRYLREFVLAAVERGVFQPDRDILAALVARLHEAPVPDPMLLLYLAYALDDNGMVGRLRELVTEMQARGAALLFDVLLLAHRPGEGQDELRASSPGMPLLARGWSGLAARGVAFYEELADVSRKRQPGLWSRYTPAAVHFFQQQPLHRR